MSELPARAPAGDEERELLLWAIGCAHRLLPVFAAQRPGDTRLQRSLDTALAYIRGDATQGALRAATFECHSAARDAGGGAPTAAARACAHAVATALAPEHASEISWYTVKALPDAGVQHAELTWQRASLPRHLRTLVYDD
ncbi:MAG: hypothetical protein QM626_09560 [Microbacterium sp.]|uniref:putative immunity protein n=1 Tax=Microbacterium sp. TaxID=51671 RepID=UPI0039E6A167